MDDPPGILPQQHLFIPVSPHDHTSAGEIDLDFHCHFTNPFFLVHGHSHHIGIEADFFKRRKEKWK